MNKFNLSSLPVEKLSGLYSGFSHPKLKGFTSTTQDSFHYAYKLKRDLYLNRDLRLFFDSEFISSGIEELNANVEKTVSKLNKFIIPT